MKRYLLTGAAGFIGAVVGEKLLDAGAEVVGIDNLNDAYDPLMKEYRLAKLRTKIRFFISEIGCCPAVPAGQ